jgi:hypothetical protein
VVRPLLCAAFYRRVEGSDGAPSETPADLAFDNQEITMTDQELQTEAPRDFAEGEERDLPGAPRDFAEGEERDLPGAPRDFAEGEERDIPGAPRDFAEGQEDPSSHTA